MTLMVAFRSIICSNCGVERFSAQRTPDGYVVVDLASAVCTPDDLARGEAESLAGELNARVAAGHHIDAVRWVLPQQVSVRTWRPGGAIDVWLYDKQTDQWVARLTDGAGGRVQWCPGSDLRPVAAETQPPVADGPLRAERMAG